MALRDVTDLKKASPKPRSRRASRPAPRSVTRGVELLEGRQLMAAFSVTNLDPSGAGSLRGAIIASNRAPGADTIHFAVSGTIRVRGASLPSIRDTVTIDGTTAPAFAGSPVVTVDFRGTGGLKFARGADGSTLRSLSLVKARDAGVTLNASRVTVEGNFIGLLADGKTVTGNRGDGIKIASSSRGNLIGRTDPVTGVDYFNASGVAIQPVSAWQGIRDSDAGGQYLIVGTSGDTGLLYDGPITGVGGTTFAVNYPGATATSVYGPDNLEGGLLRLVGSYKAGQNVVNGFLFEGATADLANAANYRTIDYPGAKYTYVHSTMGALAVGNADGPEGDAPLGTGHAFLYDVAQNVILKDIAYPGAITTTAYGIWHNGKTSYTVAGGYTDGTLGNPISHAYLADYDSATGVFTHWKSFDYPSGAIGRDFITHFEGISGSEKGAYTLVADSVQVGANNPVQGSFVSVRREADGMFGAAEWADLDDPTVQGVVSANAVAGNQVVGIVAGGSGATSYQASVNVGFRLSNVISGNGRDGIGIYGSAENRVAMNFIGTDATGMIARGNRRNGVLVTGGAARNLIGGQATGGNDPTAGIFARPPQGNLISGNGANGVLIAQGATQNLLSGNFVGTTASGSAALGNRLDGVAIVRADGNLLVGCTLQQDPFVFYNVLSGNGGDGLRVTDSDNTTVQANFMGAGADNATVLGNGGNGLLVSGSSRDTTVGGVIPLGNVISGNRRNGIEVKDRASGFISFNTFAGIFAFGGAAPNRRDGILVTSTGGDNLIRTSIVSGNLGNGIEIGGDATGVQVTETAVGTNTSINAAIPNWGSGILITGKAHGNAIGGFQPSIEPQVTVSANRRHGVEVAGSARDNVIFRTFIGTDFRGTANLGNGLDGISLGAGTSGTTIGGRSPVLQVKVLYSDGNGVSVRSSRRNSILGNQVAGSQGFGLIAQGDVAGTLVEGNAIQGNAAGDVNLTKARGISYIP